MRPSTRFSKASLRRSSRRVPLAIVSPSFSPASLAAMSAAERDGVLALHAEAGLELGGLLGEGGGLLLEGDGDPLVGGAGRRRGRRGCRSRRRGRGRRPPRGRRGGRWWAMGRVCAGGVTATADPARTPRSEGRSVASPDGERHLDPADGRAGHRAPGGDQGPHRRGRHAHHRGLPRCWPARPSPPTRDAACLARLRAADVAIVGKANLHELACGGTGVNPHFGTPVNPFDPTCIPGGSSSGNAVALADGEVDIAIGSDTAGSIRNPSACCGTAGLKTTWGRIPLDGVWPLAPSLDTVGPDGARRRRRDRRAWRCSSRASRRRPRRHR